MFDPCGKSVHDIVEHFLPREISQQESSDEKPAAFIRLFIQVQKVFSQYRCAQQNGMVLSKLFHREKFQCISQAKNLRTLIRGTNHCKNSFKTLNGENVTASFFKIKAYWFDQIGVLVAEKFLRMLIHKAFQSLIPSKFCTMRNFTQVSSNAKHFLFSEIAHLLSENNL